MRTGNQLPPSDLPKKSDYSEILDQGIAAFEHHDAQRFADGHSREVPRKPPTSPVTRTLLALVIANGILYSKYYFEEQDVLDLEEAEAQLQSSFADDYGLLKTYTTDENEFDDTNRVATNRVSEQKKQVKSANTRKK